MGDQKPINLDAVNTPEAICMFWLARPVHFLLIRLFFKELNKIPSDDAKIFALMYCGMISMKHPKLEFTAVMVGTFVGPILGMCLFAAIPGQNPLIIMAGVILFGVIPYLLWAIKGTIQTRKCIPRGLEELGYKKCPICGWYFDEDSDEPCMCKETDTNEFLE